MDLGDEPTEGQGKSGEPNYRWPVPQSAYIHVPFCRHRCGYCNFSVVAGRDDLADRFLAAIDLELERLERPAIKTLFIGGGTPTHLSVQQLDSFLGSLCSRLEVLPEVEWSVEANPEDITDEKLDVLVSHGVNRISLGVQSFDQRKLGILQRSHTGDVAQEIVRATAQRIENLSIDLIFAAPGESLDDWTLDLRTALSLPIVHLSTYALTFEKGTTFWNRHRRGELKGVSEQTEVDMYEVTREMTSQIGLEHYEVSNFARAGSRCRHNVAYWQGRGWYAAGPGAASFANGQRNVNHRSTTTYLRRMESGQSPVAESESITPLQYARERAAFGIRMIDGIDVSQLSEETGVDLHDQLDAVIDKLVVGGLLAETGGRIRLTPKGVLFADTVASEFL